MRLPSWLAWWAGPSCSKLNAAGAERNWRWDYRYRLRRIDTMTISRGMPIVMLLTVPLDDSVRGLRSGLLTYDAGVPAIETPLVTGCGRCQIPTAQPAARQPLLNRAVRQWGMRTIWVLGIALFVAACSQEGEVTGSTNACAAGLYSPYNPKVMKQCVDVCIKCNRGVTTTCTTSCTLKGAV
jgi:hypothetical protein